MATLEDAVRALEEAAQRNPSWSFNPTRQTLTLPLAGGLEFRTFHGGDVRWVLRVLDPRLSHAHTGIGTTPLDAFTRLIAHVENIDLVQTIEGQPVPSSEVTRVQGLLPELQASLESWND